MLFFGNESYLFWLWLCLEGEESFTGSLFDWFMFKEQCHGAIPWSGRQSLLKSFYSLAFLMRYVRVHVHERAKSYLFMFAVVGSFTEDLKFHTKYYRSLLVWHHCIALLFVCLSVYLSICACECFRYKSVPFYIYILICSVHWSSVQLLYWCSAVLEASQRASVIASSRIFLGLMQCNR